MKQRTRLVKDKKVRAFNTAVRAVFGFEKVFKTYCHSESSGGVWAYVRHLSQGERLAARQIQSNESIKLVVSYNHKIVAGLHLEFNESTYKVVSVDPYEFNKTDLELRAEQVSPLAYDEVEWEGDND